MVGCVQSPYNKTAGVGAGNGHGEMKSICVHSPVHTCIQNLYTAENQPQPNVSICGTVIILTAKNFSPSVSFVVPHSIFSHISLFSNLMEAEVSFYRMCGKEKLAVTV